jgi:hypothetical protein
MHEPGVHEQIRSDRLRHEGHDPGGVVPQALHDSHQRALRQAHFERHGEQPSTLHVAKAIESLADST